MSWSALSISLRVTSLATILIVLVGLSLGVFLARTRFPGKTIVEALINLPLVLPPTVVGYYLLQVLGVNNPIGRWLHLPAILFTWPAAAVASFVVGLPLMVQAARAAVASVDPLLESAARTLGSSELAVFWRVTLPLARRGILAGGVLGAARAFGEFGATLMVAGSIPGRTQTLPLAIYDAVQTRDYGAANRMVLLTSVLAFLSLWGVRRLGEGR
ncbi:MAG: molybdate ABC transporter permease subunit [Thermoleophilia bacterium]|nr:molybdate ABC transporter permease subunit [Thermoleophilia bacterium]